LLDCKTGCNVLKPSKPGKAWTGVSEVEVADREVDKELPWALPHHEALAKGVTQPERTAPMAAPPRMIAS
jgi:hypothetical protein